MQDVFQSKSPVKILNVQLYSQSSQTTKKLLRTDKTKTGL